MTWLTGIEIARHPDRVCAGSPERSFVMTCLKSRQVRMSPFLTMERRGVPITSLRRSHGISSVVAAALTNRIASYISMSVSMSLSPSDTSAFIRISLTRAALFMILLRSCWICW